MSVVEGLYCWADGSTRVKRLVRTAAVAAAQSGESLLGFYVQERLVRGVTRAMVAAGYERFLYPKTVGYFVRAIDASGELARGMTRRVHVASFQ